MAFSPELNWIASAAVEKMIFCMAEGTLLAVAVWLGLRFTSGKSSNTRFSILFSALLATAALPLFSWGTNSEFSGSGVSDSKVLTLPVAMATYGLLIWAAVAFFGLARVVAGLVQIRNMRRKCRDCSADLLGPELKAELRDFSAVRRTRILLSDAATAPVAVGFLRPAVILPAWLAEEGPSEELKHAVLHELEHLRRRDDWSNLLQKIVRAVFFFHPAVWWLERELSLERELACDDAVVQRTGNSRAYAASLARLAERSFMRRQIAMAQALVGRVHQLTHRVTRMLDSSRPAGRAWRPAVPAVIGLALLSGVSTSWAPEMVRFADTTHTAKPNAAGAEPISAEPISNESAAQVKTGAPSMTNARFVEPRVLQRKIPVAKQRVIPKRQMTPYVAAKFVDRKPQGKLQTVHQLPHQPMSTPVVQAQQASEYVLVVATEQTITAGPHGYQVSVTQLRMLVPKQQLQKAIPTKI
ncbi:MAG TPA: M56 family metallopeptidase [Candidatus Limnocylindrales bacterium]|jgi:beta-lactamase regulating signal transducer with metallopeptidase domain|nr:M56 family metallopeptidase [Candidatus Limnocylindrales bacterium]